MPLHTTTRTIPFLEVIRSPAGTPAAPHRTPLLLYTFTVKTHVEVCRNLVSVVSHVCTCAHGCVGVRDASRVTWRRVLSAACQ